MPLFVTQKKLSVFKHDPLLVMSSFSDFSKYPWYIDDLQQKHTAPHRSSENKDTPVAQGPETQ